MADEHQGNIEECKSIFPTWQWLIGIVGGCLLIVSTGSFIYATQEARQENKLSDFECRIGKVEVIQKDLDTVKTLLRQFNKEKKND